MAFLFYAQAVRIRSLLAETAQVVIAAQDQMAVADNGTCILQLGV